MSFRNMLLLLSLIFMHEITLSQSREKKTANIYNRIELYSKRGKFTLFMYKLIFRPVGSFDTTNHNTYTKLIQSSYGRFEGKKIRSVTILTMEPFGYSIADTTRSSSLSFVHKIGNHAHIKSKQLTIINLLLFKTNDLFDSLLVKDSERLLRSQNYIREVSFIITSRSDSVDIYIREVDKWSFNPKASISPSRFSLQLADKNFFGLGHEFQNKLTSHTGTSNYSSFSRYYIPNIRNTYINSTFSYGSDEFQNFIKQISIDRPFFSSFTHWAGGFTLIQQFRSDSIQTVDSVFFPQSFKFNTEDYWAGYSFQLFRGRALNERTTNFISAVRFSQTQYLQKPNLTLDTARLYTNEHLYFARIGVSTRKYLQDKYIFNYGITEDIPIGRTLSLTGGYLEKNHSGRLYAGIRVAFGNYYKWGYLSTNLEYGAFFRTNHAEQGVFSAGITYFTGLLNAGNWRFRQFIRPHVMYGLTRIHTDQLSLNGGNGIEGFNSPVLFGTKRLMLTLQTQSYSPWTLLGFHFGPYLVCSMGILSNVNNNFKNTRVYSEIALGLLIRNPNLVFNIFQVSLAFYPVIPGTGKDIFIFNSFKSIETRFSDFGIEKPGQIAYQ